MKKTIFLIASVGIILLLGGCGSKEVLDDRITLGLMPTEDTMPLIVAKEMGYFDEVGLDVHFEVFKNPKDRDAALQAGELDGTISDQMGVCLYQNAGFDMKIVSYTDCDFILIASRQTGITSVEELAGKKVAISENTVIEYALDRMLDTASISRDLVEKIPVPAIPARIEMLAGGQVDVVLLPEPFASLAIKSGGLVIAKDSQYGNSSTVLAFRGDVLDTKKDEVKSLLEAYNKGVDYIHETDISEYEQLIIDTIGFPEEMKGKIVLGNYRKSGLPDQKDIEEVIEWIEEKGINQKDIKPSDMIKEVD